MVGGGGRGHGYDRSGVEIYLLDAWQLVLHSISKDTGEEDCVCVCVH